MRPAPTRLIAVLVGFLLVRLAAWGVAELAPDGAGAARWLDEGLELLLLLGDALAERRPRGCRAEEHRPGSAGVRLER